MLQFGLTPRTFGLTSPQFDSQNADKNSGLSAFLKAFLASLAEFESLVTAGP